MKLRVFTNNADKSVARDKPPKIDAAESASSETESKRLDGRRARSQRTHALIIDTYLTLLRETQRIPTADRIAARAGLSQRGIFGHFPDLKALGKPVYELLGGKKRSRVPVLWLLGTGSIDGDIAEDRKSVV